MLNRTSSTLLFQKPVIAYRGTSAHAPENTMAAFRRAHDDGILWVEADVKLTYDGVPILMHDDRLDRTTNGKGAVADTKWEDLDRLDAGSWFSEKFVREPVPRLADFLRSIHDWHMHVNLELKPCPGRARATAMVTLIELTKDWPEQAPPPLISSYDIEALTIAANLHPECPRGLLLDAWREDWAELVRVTEAQNVHINHEALTPDRIQEIVQHGKMVLAHVVDDAVRAKELLHWGVSAVFSNDPATVLKVL